MQKKEKSAYFGLALLVGIFISASYGVGLFRGLELFFEDTLFSPKPVDSRIVIVEIDDESIINIGQWPWPREIFADFLKKVSVEEPRVVVFDILFTEPSRLGKNDDALFEKAIISSKFPIVLASEVKTLKLDKDEATAENILLPLPSFLTRNITFGLVNVIADSDGVVRRFPAKIENQEGLSLKSLAQIALEQSGQKINTEDLGSVSRIVYAGVPNSVRTISFSSFLSKSGQNNLKDKIVFVGATAPSLHDSKQTPTSHGTEMSGVEIHAQIANMLLSNLRLKELSPSLSIFLIILVALVSAIVFILVPRLELTIFASVVLGFFYTIVIIVFFEKGIVLPLVHINLSVITSTLTLSLYKFFIAEKKRREVRNAFAKYVSPQVLNELLKNPEKITLGGEEREVTVLFSDIRDFTSISEKTRPTELVRILNKYFSAVTKKIIENDGVLDKYIGDAIMAFWGAPLPEPLQADKAVKAGLQMLEELKKLNLELVENGDLEIKIGIGIYTGKAVVGNVGSEHRFDYTVIGDTVNAASRIEGLTKEYKTGLIIGESTKNQLTEKFSVKPLGKTSVKGKSQQISIYAVSSIDT